MQPDADPTPLAHGYVRMAEPDEVQISRMSKALGSFCKQHGYRLGTVFVDRGVTDEQFARTGFTDLLAAVRLDEAAVVVLPTLDHLSPHVTVRNGLKGMVEQLGACVLVVQVNDRLGPELEDGTGLGGQS